MQIKAIILTLILITILNCASDGNTLTVQQSNMNNSRNIQIESSRVYYTGKRGGCYYLNSSGRKEYVDRSLCR